MTDIIQPSFARGEIASDLYGRVDVRAYEIALRQAYNVIVHSYGGVSNRAGLRFVAPCMSFSGTPSRLVEFKYNTEDTYILEFGHEKMRVVRNDALVLEGAKNISDISFAGAPAIYVISAGHGYSTGDMVYIEGLEGSVELNNRWFVVSSVVDTDYFVIEDQHGFVINASGVSDYVSGGTVSRVYEISTPYDADDLMEIKFVQSANVMTLVHTGYQVRELSRADHDDWSLDVVTFAPEQVAPTSVNVSPITSGSEEVQYAVTAVNEETREESLPATGSSSSGAATPDNTVSWNVASGAGEYNVYRGVNGRYGYVGTTPDASFKDMNFEADLNDTPPASRNPFNSAGDYPGAVSFFQQRRVFGGTLNKPDTLYYSVVGSYANMSQSSPRQDDDAITATLSSLEVNEVRSFIPGTDLLVLTSGAEWMVSSGAEAAFTVETMRQNPQTSWGSSHLRPLTIGDKNLYVTSGGGYIRTIGFQLAIEGYTGTDVTVFAPHLFREYPVVDWALSRYPDPVIACVREDGAVCCLTFNPEQEVVGWTRWETDGKFKRAAATYPDASAQHPAHYFVVERIVGGRTVRYIERVASRVISDVADAFFVDSGLSYDNPLSFEDFELGSAGVSGRIRITVTGHGLQDGDEVDIAGIEWIADLDDVYTAVQPNQLNGGRYFVAEADADTFMLAHTSGRRDITDVSGAHPATVTSAGHGFSVGQYVTFFNVEGRTGMNGLVRKITAVTDDTFEIDDALGASSGSYTFGGQAYPAVSSDGLNAYVSGGVARKVVSEVSGAWHLEGREVVMLVDGNVVSDKVVENGSVTLDRPASRVHLGLRYVSDVETLNPEAPRGTVQGKKMRVPAVTVRMRESRGFLAGPSRDRLTEMKQREFETFGEATRLFTGDKKISISPTWGNGGRVIVRQIHPLPLNILAIILDLEEGDTER